MKEDYLETIKTEGRGNREVYEWFVDEAVSCVVGRDKWSIITRKHKLHTFVPPQAEAFAMVCLENVWEQVWNLHKWKEEHPELSKGTPEATWAKFPTKWTHVREDSTAGRRNGCTDKNGNLKTRKMTSAGYMALARYKAEVVTGRDRDKTNACTGGGADFDTHYLTAAWGKSRNKKSDNSEDGDSAAKKGFDEHYRSQGLTNPNSFDGHESMVDIWASV